MKPGRLLALAALAVLAASPATAEEGQERPLAPALPRRCGVCHLDRAPRPPPGVLAFTPPREGRAAGDAGMCYSCHNGLVRDGRRSHWTGRHHPASGSVRCGSCHTPHAPTADAGPFMRYRRGTTSWCSECHPGRRPGARGEHPAVTGDGGVRTDCGACHVVHGAAGPGLTRAGDAEAICLACHGQNPSRRGRGLGGESHPAGKGGPSCLECHAVHGTAAGGSMLGKAAAEGRVCARCHAGAYSEASRGENHPVATGGASCLACHRMHNAARPARGAGGLLREAANELEKLCLGCHKALASSESEWSHPVGVSVSEEELGRSEMLGRAGAVFGKGRKIGCRTCHRPHKGRRGTPQLVAPAQALCLYCHAPQNSLDPQRAAVGAHPVAVKPRRARVDEAFLRAGGEVGPEGELICLTCHRAHRGRKGTPGLVLGRESYSCLLCHKAEAAVAGTPHGSARLPRSVGGPGLCAGCHGEHGWRIPVSTPAGEGTVIEALCGACHGPGGPGKAVGGTNHALAITVDPRIDAAGLPLFWKDGRRLRQGMVTCATCHDVHRRSAAGSSLRAARVGGVRDLCVLCHQAQATVAGTRHDLSSQRGLTCSPCHPVHGAAAAGTWAALRSPEGRKGALVSMVCVSCHRPGGQAEEERVFEPGHPPGPVRGTSGAGAVGCGGCHDAHRWNPADPDDRGAGSEARASTSFLIQPAGGRSELCTGCHSGQASVEGSPHDLAGRTAGGKAAPGVAAVGGDGVCGGCHAVHGGEAFLLRLGAGPVGEGGAGDPCAACHGAGKSWESKAGTVGHPVGVSPGQDFGSDLPLYGLTGRRQTAGRVTCSTCHDPHRLSPPGGSGKPSPGANSFLRMGADGFAPLCFPCHADRSMVVGTDHDLRVTAPASRNPRGETPAESGVCGACHVVHDAAPGPGLFSRAPGDGTDPGSRSCTGCHREGNNLGARVVPRAEAHFVNYPGRGEVSRLFTITRTAGPGRGLPIALYTEDGRRGDRGYLSCASCHDIHRWTPDVSSSGSGVPAEGDESNSFLRLGGATELERSLCGECHGEAALGMFRNYHFPAGR